jgi:hypothetical protein
MIFALFGVWDVVRAQPDDGHAAEIFERGAATVEALLPRYDTGWWSLCDLYHLEAATPRNPCTAHYHDIHIKQLRVMHAITGRDAFDALARRWATFQEGMSGRLRAYAGQDRVHRAAQAGLSGRAGRAARWDASIRRVDRKVYTAGGP